MEKLASFRKTRVKKVFIRLGMRIFFGLIRFPFMEGDRRSNFSGGWTISSLKGRRGWLLLRKGGFVSLVYNRFPDRDDIGNTFLSRRRRRSQFINEFLFVR